jgi:hypothetical protein
MRCSNYLQELIGGFPTYIGIHLGISFRSSVLVFLKIRNLNRKKNHQMLYPAKPILAKLKPELQSL